MVHEQILTIGSEMEPEPALLMEEFLPHQSPVLIESLACPRIAKNRLVISCGKSMVSLTCVWMKPKQVFAFFLFIFPKFAKVVSLPIC